MRLGFSEMKQRRFGPNARPISIPPERISSFFILIPYNQNGVVLNATVTSIRFLAGCISKFHSFSYYFHVFTFNSILFHATCKIHKKLKTNPNNSKLFLTYSLKCLLFYDVIFLFLSCLDFWNVIDV